MKQLTCFVAGAYSSKFGWPGRVFNVIKMAIYVRRLVKLGVMPIAPNVMYCLFAGLQSREFWLSGTQAIQSQCDISFFVTGWEGSGGAKAEYAFAVINHQPTFTSLLSLEQTLQLR